MDANIKLARYAMGTRFEILLHGEEERFLRAAGEEALEEIERLDRQFSLFRPDSEISRLNHRAAHGAIRVEPGLFRLLQACRQLSDQTGGAFDITIGPLMHCWGFRKKRDHPPSAEEVAAARGMVGMQHVILNETERTVQFDREGIALDLGAVAKGWALDEATLLLQEAGVEHALLHGGTSTTRALGHAPGADNAGWTFAVRPPPPELLPDKKPWPEEFVRKIVLRDEALSVSGAAGRFLERDGQIDCHVLDPRRGNPVREGLLAAVVSADATASDALSTALLAGGPALQEEIAATKSDIRSLVLNQGDQKDEGGLRLHSRGL